MEDTAPNSPDAKKPWFEPVTAILMAVASLSTAWCSYQSSLWSEASSGYKTQADSLDQQAAAQHVEARQIEFMQMRLWVEAVDAIVDKDEKLANFYTNRFEDELKPAYQKWIALNPFDNPVAPPHPFVHELYTPRFQDEILEAKAQAKLAGDQAHLASHYATNYLGISVVLATVLFFAGTADRFDWRQVRLPTLAFAVAMFVYAAVRMGGLPVA